MPPSAEDAERSRILKEMELERRKQVDIKVAKIRERAKLRLQQQQAEEQRMNEEKAKAKAEKQQKNRQLLLELKKQRQHKLMEEKRIAQEAFALAELRKQEIEARKLQVMQMQAALLRPSKQQQEFVDNGVYTDDGDRSVSSVDSNRKSNRSSKASIDTSPQSGRFGRDFDVSSPRDKDELREIQAIEKQMEDLQKRQQELISSRDKNKIEQSNTDVPSSTLPMQRTTETKPVDQLLDGQFK
jgi:hypothetical protein